MTRDQIKSWLGLKNKLDRNNINAFVDSLAFVGDTAYQNAVVAILSESGVVELPAGLYIADLNIIVTSGNPTISIQELPDFGAISGQTIYRNSANFESTGSLHFDMSGTGTIKVQIVKFNV